MKIAYVMINVNRRDGSARAVAEVAERLSERHEVHLFARKVEDLDLSRIRWHRIPGVGWPEVADFLSFHWSTALAPRTADYDIIHSIGCNAREANVITIQNIQPVKARILKQFAREENVSPLRSATRSLYLHFTSAAEKRLYEGRLRNGKRPMFLPVSRGVQRELETSYAIKDAPIRIIPNAADCEIFKPFSISQKAAWRQRYGFLNEDSVAIFAGGEWARKGLDLAIKGLAGTDNKRIKLYVAGTDPDKDRFMAIARECGVQERVVFGGFQNNISEAYASADLFLFPSCYEAFSLATIEAAACGLPILASRINGAEDFVVPGVNGDFVRHDPTDIAEKLDINCREKDRLRTMGQEARRIVVQQYTWDKVSHDTEKAYADYLQNRVAPDVNPILVEDNNAIPVGAS